VSEEEIYAGLTDIVREIFGDDTIVLNARTTAPDIKGWDSINNINIIVAAEVRFGVRLSGEEIESLANVGDFVRAIRSRSTA
jgi:acyl carrier protein